MLRWEAGVPLVSGGISCGGSAPQDFCVTPVSLIAAKTPIVDNYISSVSRVLFNCVI